MKRTLIALTILACALSGARAGLILSDDFNYNDGPIAQPTADGINPDSTWLSNSGTTPMDVTNDTLIVTSSRSEDMIHLLDGEPYLTNDARTTYLYSRFTLKCTYLPTASGTYFAGFGGTNAFAAGGANVSRLPRSYLCESYQLSGWERRGGRPIQTRHCKLRVWCRHQQLGQHKFRVAYPAQHQPDLHY